MLRCYDCGATATTGARCDCGEPLWFDTEEVVEATRWPTGRGLPAFADWLPIDAPREGLAAAAGGTPLVREPALDADGARAYLKIEGTNPTGSFKDRGSAVGVTAVRRGVVASDTTDDGASAGANSRATRSTVGTVSHGNMAVSMAAHAGSAGLDCVVLVPADVSDARLRRIAAHDPRIYRVDGDYGQLYYDALSVDGIRFVNSDVPLRVAGQKTTVLELLRSFATNRVPAEREAPDAILLPVSSGGHASGAWKAIRDARAAGLLAADDTPRLYLVQAAACDPIARADRRGDDRVTRLAPEAVGETIAYSIANADPPSGTRALRGARATGGRVVSVDDPAIRAAHGRLAQLGYRVEPSCATVLAAFDRLRADGVITADEEAVLVTTGVDYETVGGGEETTGAETLEAPVIDRTDLSATLASVA